MGFFVARSYTLSIWDQTISRAGTRCPNSLNCLILMNYCSLVTPVMVTKTEKTTWRVMLLKFCRVCLRCNILTVWLFLLEVANNNLQQLSNHQIRQLNNMSFLALKCQRLLLKVSLSRKWIRLRLKVLVSKIQAELWKLLNQLLTVFANKMLTK